MSASTLWYALGGALLVVALLFSSAGCGPALLRARYFSFESTGDLEVTARGIPRVAGLVFASEIPLAYAGIRQGYELRVDISPTPWPAAVLLVEKKGGGVLRLEPIRESCGSTFRESEQSNELGFWAPRCPEGRGTLSLRISDAATGEPVGEETLTFAVETNGIVFTPDWP